jgi:hypothetical protein
MPFDPSKFEGTIFMLLVLTAGMMMVRMKARLDNNWPVFYWALFTVVAAGAVAALLLRFEFMASGLMVAFQIVEFAVWGYILYYGCILVFL